MKAIVLLFMLFAGGLGCVPAGTEVLPLNGTYIGYFHRSGEDTARVMLRFADNSFEGISNKIAYPAIGSGRFKQSGNSLVFTCRSAEVPAHGVRAALDGEYNFQYNDDGTIRLWKEQSKTGDEFILKAYSGEMVVHHGPPASGTKA